LQTNNQTSLSQKLTHRYQLINSEIDTKAKIYLVCKKDIHYWLDNFCWTYDPRKAKSEIPFYAYDFQRPAIDWILEHIALGKDGLIEKSRTMGATWLFVYVFQWLWQFGEGGNDFLIGSQKQDDVDRIGDMRSIFQKLKYNINKQPMFLYYLLIFFILTKRRFIAV